jgi:hypothetical protein
MTTSAQDFNAQIEDKFRANGGRVGGPFEPHARDTADERCRTLAAASRLHPQLELATPSRTNERSS